MASLDMWIVGYTAPVFNWIYWSIGFLQGLPGEISAKFLWARLFGLPGAPLPEVLGGCPFIPPSGGIFDCLQFDVDSGKLFNLNLNWWREPFKYTHLDSDTDSSSFCLYLKPQFTCAAEVHSTFSLMHSEIWSIVIGNNVYRGKVIPIGLTEEGEIHSNAKKHTRTFCLFLFNNCHASDSDSVILMSGSGNIQGVRCQPWVGQLAKPIELSFWPSLMPDRR
jgi:hypothetical protein